MAEHNIIRRVGGDMEPFRGITSRRILLPQEVELCNVLGLSEEEYWYFVDKTESYNGQRSEAYDLVPDIRAGFVSSAWFIQLAIGVALTVVAYLLTPKPKQPKTPPSLKTADAQGPKRYSPQTGFDSLQDVAEIGQIIPLVFADFDANKNGGVRVNSKLIWSQLRSLGAGQQLKSIFLLSSGALGGDPEFSGYAIGDTLLENYIHSKLKLYFREGSLSTNKQRFRSGDAYEEGTLAAEKSSQGKTNAIHLPVADSYTDDGLVDTYFSSTRSPQTQAIFGAYSPIPNGQKFMLPYELVLKAKDAKGSVKTGVDKKRKKIKTYFPRYCALYRYKKGTAGFKEDDGHKTLNPGDIVKYKIEKKDVANKYKNDFGDWKAEDVESSINAVREEADDILAIGNQYLVGTATAVCISANYDDIWEPGSASKIYTLKIEERGVVEIRNPEHKDNSYGRYVVMKLAEGIVTNTRGCDVTEIGLKSKVWKQITGFPNVNSHPGHWEYGKAGVVKNYENDNGSISLGSINKYITRLSFFNLYVREAGGDNKWELLNGRPFCIKGRTPQPQYNQIRIEHDFGQYEFKFLPYPGNRAYDLYRDKDVYLLKNGLEHETISKKIGKLGKFYIRFEGDMGYRLTPNACSNQEWWLGEVPTASTKGEVKGFNKRTKGTIPTSKEWVVKTTRNYSYDSSYGTQNGVRRGWNSGDGGYFKYYWGGKHVGTEYVSDYRLSKGLVKSGYKYTKGSAVDTSGTTTRWGIKRAVKEDVDTLKHTSYTRTATTKTGSGSGLKVTVKRYTNNAATWSVKSAGKNYQQGDKIEFSVPKHGGGSMTISCTVKTDENSLKGDPWPKSQNLNPYDAISDYVVFDGENASHLSEPEHEITYVNELIEMEEDKPMPYTQMAIAGLRMNSSTEWNSFQELSAYIKKGIKVERLIKSGTSSSNLFPEIAYHLLTDKMNGAGDLIGATSIDRDSMELAARFCEANKFFWDGVITESQNLREFIYEQACYCFLDFTIIGGRFALKPSVPYKTKYQIHHGAKPEIKALFTDGNTKDLKVSFLTPEERQLFQAKVIYREEDENGFAETKVFESRLSSAQGGSSKDPYEVFDMSIFCTNQQHARDFARFALKVRKDVDHGIKFTTTPQSAMHLEPGQYFRYYSESTHTDRFANGVVAENGIVQSQINLTAGSTYNVYYWKPGEAEVRKADMKLDDEGKAGSTFRGSVFTIAQTNASDRVYKLESLVYGEEGFVEVAGSYQPLTSTGSLAILDWDDEYFEETPG